VTVLPIRIVGEPVLHTPAAEVTEFDGDLRRLIADMTETMHAANGVGLAAPQVGVGLRVFVYDVDMVHSTEGGRVRGHLVNPRISVSPVPETMPDEEDDEEGCLSVPGENFPTGRAAEATVTGYDDQGDRVTVTGTGLLARCLQHEYDHLDGLLYLDRLVGRWVKAARRAVRRNGWGTPGLTWMPGVDPDPFGH
jgi:peptide deformylase